MKKPKNIFKKDKRPTRRELISMESRLGATIFGPSGGRRREFFNLDPTTWIWHEEYTDMLGRHRTTTVRYEVQVGKGILKYSQGSNYSYLQGDELRNFKNAVKAYHDLVKQQIYN
ncbi:hypothetical protein FWF48_02215 [Candidatus Saccharibacteria bacterium]|nr:hypothetical protein [Candidatus Saccharibacteria bacterium]